MNHFIFIIFLKLCNDHVIFTNENDIFYFLSYICMYVQYIRKNFYICKLYL